MLQDDETVIEVGPDESGMRCVQAAGKLDWSIGRTIGRRLSAVSEKAWQSDTILLDLAGVNFLDSAGISSLLSFRKELLAAGGRLVLCSPTPRIREIFELVGMHEIIPVADSPEHARGMVDV